MFDFEDAQQPCSYLHRFKTLISTNPELGAANICCENLTV